MRTEACVPEMVFIQGLITVGKRLLNATVKQEEIPTGTDKLQGIYLSCANFSVLYHLPASQTALQMLWITDVHNWCPSIGLWTPSSYWQLEGPSEVHRFDADIQNHSCDKGSGGSWDPVTALLWAGAGRWSACRHTRGKLCAHSLNAGICLCKLIFNLLPTWCWVLDVTQWKVALDYLKISVQVHLHSQKDCATRGNDFWSCVMFAGPDHRNRGQRLHHLLPSAKPLPPDIAFPASHLILTNWMVMGSSFWL